MANKNTKKTDKISYEYQQTKLRHAVNGFIREIENNLQNNMIIPKGVNDICFSFCCIFKQYQDLKCYRCGDNYVDKMIICTYETLNDKERNDDFVRNEYSALCPSHTDLLGRTWYKSMVIINKE